MDSNPATYEIEEEKKETNLLKAEIGAD